MGVITKIAFLVLFFFTINLSAQTAYDTIYFSGKQFVEHFAKVGESLKKIAKLHNVKIADIKDVNELGKRLYYNQLLYIPIYLNNIDEEALLAHDLVIKEKNEIDTTVTNIALLMPYYLVKNDTMFNNYEDALEIPNTYYKKSEDALSFHVGVELAIDSLRKSGKKIILHTFDTNQDTLEVREIVYSNKLNQMDIIIGPMYSKFFQMMCKKYGRDTAKLLISPLSRNSKGIKQYPAVYQIALTNEMQVDILSKYLIENKLGERIILLHDEHEKGLATYIKYKFSKVNKTIESFQVDNTKVDSIRKFFIAQQNVFLLSSNKAFISKMLGSIGGIDSISIVYTFESIKLYDNLDITNLMELDVHIPNSSSINYTNDFDKKFLALYEKEYNTNPRKHTKTAYNLIMHFCGNTKVYNFKRARNGYFENISAPIYHYSDYELLPLSPKTN